MIREKPATGEIYHIYNRGVEKRNIFLKDKDYLRFIHDLFEFNDRKPALNLGYFLNRQSIEVGLRYIDIKQVIEEQRTPRRRLVDLLAFSLMPNHFHLMLQQRVDGGITKFMRKLGTGYTNHFNKKYDRVGSLFQGIYKIVRLTTQAHLLHLPFYIHANALDLTMPEWREKEIKKPEGAGKFLAHYRWSSHLDYLEKQNFPSLTQRNFLLELFGGTEGYEGEFVKWLTERGFDELENVILE